MIFFRLLKRAWNYVVVADIPIASMNKRECLRKKTEACLQKQYKRTKVGEDRGVVKKWNLVRC